MAVPEREREIYALADELLRRVRGREAIPIVIADIQERIAQIQAPIRLQFIDILNCAAWQAYRHDTEMSACLIRSVGISEWNKGTTKLARKLTDYMDGVDIPHFPKKHNLPPDILPTARQHIQQGSVDTGVDILLKASNIPRGWLITVAIELLKAGHTKESARLVEPLLHAGAIRNKGGLGYEMDALNVLARCARADPSLVSHFERSLQEAIAQGGLAPEYGERARFVFRTGRVFDPAKFRRTAARLGEENRFIVKHETMEQLKQMPPRGEGIEMLQSLPDLDESGEAKREFCRLIESQRITEACALLYTFKRRSPNSEIRGYEQQIYSAICLLPPESDLLESVVQAYNAYPSFLTLALRKLFQAEKQDDALSLFWRLGRSQPRVARALGQLLFEQDDRSRKLIAAKAELITVAGAPLAALEMIKPTLLHSITNGSKPPLVVLQRFAHCAALDAGACEDFVEQLGEYRSNGLLNETAVRGLLDIATSRNPEKALQMINRVQSVKRRAETEEQFRGRIARSRFFQEPHDLLKARPIDRVAARVSGWSRRRTSERQRRNRNNDQV